MRRYGVIMPLRLTLLIIIVFGCAILQPLSAQALPIITLPVRVHLVQSETLPAMHTTLTEDDIRRVFGKINAIWAKAGIQFELESIGPTQAVPLSPEERLKPEFERVKAMIPKGRLSADAIDVCYVKQVTPNGFYYGEPIVVKDTASLKEVPGGLDEPLPRVTAHEIGHALGLNHRQDTTNLMQSGTTGFDLNEEEIATARAKALERSKTARRSLQSAFLQGLGAACPRTKASDASSRGPGWPPSLAQAASDPR